jgi:hypothetical protein
VLTHQYRKRLYIVLVEELPSLVFSIKIINPIHPLVLDEEPRQTLSLLVLVITPSRLQVQMAMGTQNPMGFYPIRVQI